MAMLVYEDAMSWQAWASQERRLGSNLAAHYRTVERGVRRFRELALTDRQDVAWFRSWHDDLALTGEGIPFRAEAEQFAVVYWRSRG